MVRALLILAVCSWPAVALAADAIESEPVDYAAHIKPLLASHCVACHGVLKQEGGLRLDTAKLAITGGDSGSAIVPGDPAASRLIERVTAADPAERMPQDREPLEPAQITRLRRWIELGAPAPADERPDENPRDHWAFRQVVRPPLPKSLPALSAAWVRNPIDALVAEKHAAAGLTPQLPAPRAVLIRRAYLDLLGVPPTSEEWNTHLAAQDSDWFEQLVDHLLADPRYGERWARHWMDIWRYSDWWGLGDQLRNSAPHIWHWRDWIIESLNADLAYDEMVRLMLAADESHPNDLQRLRATGFLVRNYFLFNRPQWLDESVEHVSKGLLGLTMNCAKCHDHKYDPIEQVDYYRMKAFFEPYHVRQDVVPGEADLARDGIPRAFDRQLDAPTYLLVRGQESQPDRSQVILPSVPEFFAFDELKIEPLALPVEAWQPARRAWVIEAHRGAAQQQVAAAAAALAAAQAKLASARELAASRGATGEASQPTEEAAECRLAELALAAAQAEERSVECRIAAMQASWAKSDAAKADATATADPALAEAERAATAAAVVAQRQLALARAESDLAKVESRLAKATDDQKAAIEKELKAAREAVESAHANIAAEIKPDDTYVPLIGALWTPTRFLSSLTDDPQVAFAAQSTGRRSALARWITDPRNPLTARVAVNHLWNRHFGTPLVATVFDFGRKNAPPVERELLDWLVAEFMDSGWSMKHLHRLIATSATYRLSSSLAAATNDCLAKDPENHYLWRRTPIRLESQVVRDSILALAGKLDATLGGPSIAPAEQAASTRRSLYFYHSNNDRDRFLLAFDEASVKECYRRDQSIVPQQALTLANGALVHDALGAIANRLASSENPALDDATFARRAFLVLLGIEASDAEVAACLQALEAWRGLPTDGDSSAANSTPRARLIWALINHNDFVTLR
ncbi:MAG: PSD1 and planctomycete cytochrome C domain-containing protein [Pirellulales bacterium]|nr:PSD1 and planctomycete cytochrome C domain-containing protein [Pirellulales bacterium]